MKDLIIKIQKHPFGGDFLAINLFCIIFTVRDLTPVEINHERIHSAQQRELLFIPFFIWYIIEWFILYVKYKDSLKAYYNIRFEKEAYYHEKDLNYLINRKHYRYK